MQPIAQKLIRNFREALMLVSTGMTEPVLLLKSKNRCRRKNALLIFEAFAVSKSPTPL